MNYKAMMLEVQDFPKEGVLFRDISPILDNPISFDNMINDMYLSPFRDKASKFMGLDARGFIFAGALAQKSRGSMIMARKKGKMPRPTIVQSYDLEYGSAEIEVHPAKFPGTEIIIVDDLIATGGSLVAAIQVARKAGYKVVGCTCFVELKNLGGREKVEALGVPLHTVVQY